MTKLIPTCRVTEILELRSGKLTPNIEKALNEQGIKPVHAYGGKKNDKYKLWDPAQIYKFKETYTPEVQEDRLGMLSPSTRARIREYVLENNAMLRAICINWDIKPEKAISDFFGRPQEDEEGEEESP
jgi:hypothetical protein